MITPKSLKYSHKKTCSANKSLEPVIEKQPKERAKAAEAAKAPQETQPEVMKPLTAEEKRKQARRSREERLTNLFMGTLKRQIKNLIV